MDIRGTYRSSQQL